MVTTVVMMTQHVAAADVSTAAATTAPSEHLSVTNASGHMTAASPCGSSVVVYSPTKLREEEKRIQMVSELIGIRYHGGLCIVYTVYTLISVYAVLSFLRDHLRSLRSA